MKYEIAYTVRFWHVEDIPPDADIGDYVRSQVLFPEWQGLYQHIGLEINPIKEEEEV